MNGIINIYKEPGFTSFDVVAKLRGILKQKKIGHTGTLDPAAQGVLPVCIGKATKLCDFLTDGKKTYEAVLLLGVSTDTLDMEGQVLKTCPVLCSENEVREAVMSFLGEQEQIPPMYSALKVNGKKMYELARQGLTIERKPRKVTFYNIDILKIDLPRVTISVTCSKGTYIRSLCDDIGNKLGCGAAMEKLTRTQSGGFTIDEAHRLSEVEEFVKNGKAEEIILPMDEALSKYPEIKTSRYADKAARNGNKISENFCITEETDISDGLKVRLYDSEDHFIGIYEYRNREKLFKPVKILFE
jgi:tRNA pseudouridine55 synthase